MSLFPELRSSRRKEALTSFARGRMSLLTSAATIQDFAATERKEHREEFLSLRSLRSFAAIIFLTLFSSVALADDVITNVMSPILA